MAIEDTPCSVSGTTIVNASGLLQQVGNLAAIITTAVPISQQEASNEVIFAYIMGAHSIIQLLHFVIHSALARSLLQTEQKLNASHIIMVLIHFAPIVYGAVSYAVQQSSAGTIVFSYAWAWIHFALFTGSLMTRLNSSTGGTIFAALNV